MIYDVKTGAVTIEWEVPGSLALAVQFSPIGKRLATYSATPQSTGHLNIWQLPSGGLGNLLFSPNASKLLASETVPAVTEEWEVSYLMDNMQLVWTSENSVVLLRHLSDGSDQVSLTL